MALFKNAKHSLLFLVALLFIARIFSASFMPLTDPSEGRYSAMARNMDISGNFLVPHYTYRGIYQSFDGKPPLYFQSAALSCRLFGHTPLGARFPSLLSAVLLILLAYHTAKRTASERAAVWVAVFGTLNVIFYVFAGIAITDMLLTFSICGAILSYMLFLNAPERCEKKCVSILFFAMLGIGMLTKGPIAVGLAGLPIFFYTVVHKRWKDLKDHAWFLGVGLFLAIAVPWFALMTKENPDFLHYFFVNENFKRFFSAGEYGDKYGSGRDYFYGVSAVWFLAVNAPFYLLLVPCIFSAAKTAPEKDVNSLAAWAFCSITLFWCLTIRVPVYYLLPTAPMLAFTLGVLLDRSGLLDGAWERRFRIGAWCFGILLGIGLFIAGIVSRYYMDKSTQIPLKMLEEYSEKCYFAEETPYTAEFYAGHGRLCPHPSEEVTDSLRKSKDCFLLFRIDPWLRLTVLHPELIGPDGAPLGRKILFRQGLWTVCSPENWKQPISQGEKE